MKRIALTGSYSNGSFVSLDDDDFSYLKGYTWFFDSSSGYAKRSYYLSKLKKTKQVFMHREILEHNGIKFIKGLMTDHVNMNKLDNRRKNLRVVSGQMNGINRLANKNNKSGYKGVFLAPKKFKLKPWRAQIKVNHKSTYLGTFFTKEDAALAYNKAAKKYFGNFARLNIVK